MPAPPDSRMFRFLRAFSRGFVTTYHRAAALNPSTIPPTGPAIIAPNHTAGLDPLAVQAFVDRPVIWMMAAEYARIPFTKWFWRATRVILVERDGHDSAALRSALRVLKDGEVLGIFPEGRIEPTRELLPLQPGIAQLSDRTKAPVIPVWIDGTQRNRDMLAGLVIPTDITVLFGKPFLSPPDQLSDTLATGLKALQHLSQNLTGE